MVETPPLYRMMPSQESVALTATWLSHQSMNMVLLLIATSSSDAGSESATAQRTCESVNLAGLDFPHMLMVQSYQRYGVHKRLSPIVYSRVVGIEWVADKHGLF